jgi:hypothetical protein
MKIRDGFYMKHYEVAGGARYRTEACNEHGPWTGEIYQESRTTKSQGRRGASHTFEDRELKDPSDGDEVCDLVWKRSGLKAKKSR